MNFFGKLIKLIEVKKTYFIDQGYSGKNPTVFVEPDFFIQTYPCNESNVYGIFVEFFKLLQLHVHWGDPT